MNYQSEKTRLRSSRPGFSQANPSDLTSINVRLAGFTLTPAISAAFYQAEDEALSVPLIYDIPRPRFYSALDAKGISLQCDRAGKLIFVQIKKPRRLWIGSHGLEHVPSPAADIRFLDFRRTIAEPEYLCSAKHDRVLVKFGDIHSCDSYQIGDSLFIYIYRQREMRGLLIDNVLNDRAGKGLAKWRKLVAEGAGATGASGAAGADFSNEDNNPQNPSA